MEEEKFRERKKLESLVEKMDRDADAVVVEGYRDRILLEKLGFSGRIFESAELTLEDLVENVSRAVDRVVVLTDFDRHGKKRNLEIASALEKEVDVLRTSRKRFGQQLTSTGRRDVEDALPLFRDRDEKFVESAMDGLFFRN